MPTAEVEDIGLDRWGFPLPADPKGSFRIATEINLALGCFDFLVAPCREKRRRLVVDSPIRKREISTAVASIVSLAEAL